MMKLTFLGTGTSTGVPQMRCRCAACRSVDPRDSRLRASAMVELPTGHNVLIDCGPDLRQQLLRLDSPDLHSLLITHSHYDHVGGIDDMRPYCPTAPEGHFPVYCRPDVATDLRSRVPYCFARNPYPGVPTFDIHEINGDGAFFLDDGTELVPLPVFHGRLPIVGYRIGKLAYITDCSMMPETTYGLIRGIDTLVINALRHEKHPTHMNLREALDVIKLAAPRQAYLTHLNHDMGPQADVEPTLPPGVTVAYDGLSVEIPD